MADRFRFGDCELRLVNRELLCAGVAVEVQPRTFDVLSYLVTHAGRLVGKDELLDQVWGHRAVSESALARTIMKVRKAIDDDAHDPRFILTQHGYGYRFIGDVVPVALPLVEKQVPVGPTETAQLHVPVSGEPAGKPAIEITKVGARAPQASKRAAWRWWLVIALMLAGILGFGVWILWLKNGTDTMVRKRLAVLPIINATGDSSMNWTRLGLMSLMENVIGRIDHVNLVPVAETLGALKVVGADKVSDKTPEQIRQIKRVLKAGVVVQTWLRDTGGGYSLQIGLVTGSGKRVTHTFSGSNPAALVNAAGDEIGHFLQASSSASSSGRTTKKPVTGLSLDPYINETYMRALNEKAQGHFASSSQLFGVVVQAMKDQPKAVQLEPMLQFAETLEKAGQYRKAMKLAGKTIGIAQNGHNLPSLARSYEVMSNANENVGNLEVAKTYAHKELALASPKYPGIAPRAQLQLGELERLRSRYGAAERLVRAAIVGYRRMGSDFHLAGGYLELGTIMQYKNAASAILYDEKALKLARKSGHTFVAASALIDLATAQSILGNCQQSLQYLDQAQPLAKSIDNLQLETLVHLGRAKCEEAQGNVGAALKELREARKVAKTLGDPSLEALALLQYVNVLSQSRKNSRPQIEKLYVQVANMFEKAGEWGQASGSLLNAAQMMTHDGEYDAAAKVLIKSASLARKAQDQNLFAAIDVANAELEYGRGSKSQALAMLQKARSQSSRLSRTWVNVSASLIWLQLEMHHVTKAADVYAQTIGVGNGYATLCIASARLLYAQKHFADALKRQQTCLTHLGGRVTDIDRSIRDAYRAAVKSGKHVALPDKPPPMLWL